MKLVFALAIVTLLTACTSTEEKIRELEERYPDCAVLTPTDIICPVPEELHP